MSNHNLAWTAPQPFWTGTAGAVAPRGTLAQPQILRFATDDFMPELLSALEQDPASLTRYAVIAETWRGPVGAPAAPAERWLQREPARLLDVRRMALMRSRARNPQSPAAPQPTSSALKLYQPAHLRHYLVSGSLVCQMPGLPDRTVDPARHKVSFVVRRLLPKAPVPPDTRLPDPANTELWDEYAYVPRGKTAVWRKVAAADDEAAAAVLLPGEERLAMFPSIYMQDDGQRRRLFVGNVPVARREAYQGASADAESGGGDDSELSDPRVVEFHMQVLGPWKALVNRVMSNGAVNGNPDDADHLRAARPDVVFARKSSLDIDGLGDPLNRNTPDVAALRDIRSGVQTSSWYLLLDLYLYLKKHLEAEFLDVIEAGATPAGPARALYDALNGAAMPSSLNTAADNLRTGTGSVAGSAYRAADIELNLIQALGKIAEFESALEAASNSFEIPDAGTTKPAGWPDFLFFFADPWFGVLQPPPPPGFTVRNEDYISEKIQARIDTLARLVKQALPPPAGRPVAEPTLASMLPVDMREAWYVMRLVYERPDCAPFHANVVSAATQPFQMAGFFDPDAPARPIRIGLPVDISPAGLRKFDKNTAFVMSDMLCGQVDRMKGLGLVDLVLSVLPWPFHKPLSVPEKGPCKAGDVSLGVMCSLSIPIVTIVALLLMMIIVSLLDAIFRWLPYLMVCFPLPGFKGKKEP